jgi:hypothetical protein
VGPEVEEENEEPMLEDEDEDDKPMISDCNLVVMLIKR